MQSVVLRIDCTGQLRSVPEPIQLEDKAISLATTPSKRLKGMRRRAETSLPGSSQHAQMPAALDALLGKLQQWTDSGVTAGAHILACSVTVDSQVASVLCNVLAFPCRVSLSDDKMSFYSSQISFST